MISTLKNGCWASVFIWKVFIISSSLLWIVLSSTAYTCLFVTDNFNCISRDPKRIVGVLLSCLWSEWRRFHHQVILIVEMWQRINAEKISFYSYAYIYGYLYIYIYSTVHFHREEMLSLMKNSLFIQLGDTATEEQEEGVRLDFYLFKDLM